MDTTTPTLTTAEAAIATIGHETADLSAAHAAQWAATMGGIYDLPDGLTWPQYRDQLRIGAPELDPDARDEVWSGVPVRIAEPLTRPVRGTYLHIHGGGWCLGSHRSLDTQRRKIAESTGLRTVSVGYRQPPEHPFPACLADCLTVADAIDDPVRIIGGESAGAHLSALVLQRRPSGWAGALLTFGVFDLAGTPSAGTRLDTPVTMLLGDVPRDRWRDPQYSPLYGDLTGMPPALFVVGTRDGLLDDTMLLAARWSQVAPVRTEIVAGAGHGFTLGELPVNEDIWKLQLQWLADRVVA